MKKEDFKECFDMHFDSVRNYVYYRCGDAELATDIAQDTFMKIWEKKIAYHPKKTVGLLFKIARDSWISQYRKQQSASKYELSLSVCKEHHDPASEMELKQLMKDYEKSLQEMPESQRSVFLMSRMDDLTYREIALRLGVSIKAVEKRMTQALKSLRLALYYEK